jgi:hypothetical protein
MNDRKITSSFAPPSACNSSYHCPSISTGMRTGGNAPGIELEARTTAR